MTESVTMLQVLNRYSYVGNNPLSFTDATGYSWLSKLFRSIPILRAIFAIIVAAVFQQWEALTVAFGEVGATFISGFVAGGISGGSLKSALLGGLQAIVLFGIGEALEGVNVISALSKYKNGGTWWTPGEMLAVRGSLHGFVGGLASVANGGSFGSGFLSAGFSNIAGAAIKLSGLAANTVKQAVLGGAGSLLGGGKFVNGAITGAFGYLFNECLHGGCRMGLEKSVHAASQSVDEYFKQSLAETEFGQPACLAAFNYCIRRGEEAYDMGFKNTNAIYLACRGAYTMCEFNSNRIRTSGTYQEGYMIWPAKTGIVAMFKGASDVFIPDLRPLSINDITSIKDNDILKPKWRDLQ